MQRRLSFCHPRAKDGVESAAVRIADEIVRTPVVMVGETKLKAESFQTSGSFKMRAAANSYLMSPCSEVVTASSGNFGLALAELSLRRSFVCTCFVRRDADAEKLSIMREFGINLQFIEGSNSSRDAAARAYAADRGIPYLPSGGSTAAVLGNATMALELVDDLDGIDRLFVPVGNGGLLAGLCVGLWSWPGQIVGVEPKAIPRLGVSIDKGQAVQVTAQHTLADGLMAEEIPACIWPILKARVNRVVSMDEQGIKSAWVYLSDRGIPTEPSGAVAFAGACADGAQAGGCAVVTGANGINGYNKMKGVRAS